jgi:hypothetical protein
VTVQQQVPCWKSPFPLQSLEWEEFTSAGKTVAAIVHKVGIALVRIMRACEWRR